MEFHQHPDGLVFIRDGDRVFYRATIDEFNADAAASGLNAYVPLSNIKEVRYDGARRITFDGVSQRGIDGSWADGDAYITAVDGLKTKQRQRENPIPSLGAAKAQKITEIKTGALIRISRIYPEWKQRNLIARGVVIAAKPRDTWTAQEVADFDATKLVFERDIQGIRTASDGIEADLNLLVTSAEVLAFDVDAAYTARGF